MCRHQPHEKRCILFTLAAVLVVSALGSGRAAAQFIITEIIDATGDGAGNDLDRPQSIAVDAAGNAYVTGRDSTGRDNDNAFMITPAGIITEIIDAAGDGVGNSLGTPEGIAVDAAGNVYVAGSFSNNAFKIALAGVTLIIDAAGDGAGNVLGAPVGMAVDAAGNVYVTGFTSDNAFKITPDLVPIITEIIDAAGDPVGNALDEPQGIAVDAAGNVYVAGHGSDNAFKITPAGVITQIIDSTGDGAGNGLTHSHSIAVDAAGNVYVTGGFSDNAFKITPAGVITQIIDDSGDGAGNSLDGPNGIAVDAAGNAYVAAYNTDNAFKITPAGVITEIVDDSGDGAGNSLDGPYDIAVDAAGNAYVTGWLSLNAFKIAPDCNNNGIPDATDLTADTSQDCNANAIPDECDIAAGTSRDCSNNGIPDECDLRGQVQETQKLTASDAGAGDGFGLSVSISGDVAVIGAEQDDDGGSDSGSANVYRFDGTNWVEQAKLTASDAAAGDGFGSSVSVSGDVAVIGAVYDGDHGTESGSAYVFARDEGGADNWGQVAKLTASDGAPFDVFASSVFISGDVVVIGAPGDGDAGSNSGSAYVFQKPPGGWEDMTETVKLAASDAAPLDWFGSSVCISGDVAVIGAWAGDDAGTDSGSAYVFARSEGGPDNWGQVAKLTASDAAEEDRFGASVSISGDVAVIGARRDDDGGSDSGSAYVYRFDGANWAQEAKLTASDATPSDEFGASVSISADLAVIAAWKDNHAGTDSGSAYVYRFDGTNWVEQAKLTASDAAAGDELGRSVSISGQVALTGAPGGDDGGSASGSAYVFLAVSPIDCNANGIPDECETDSDGDGTIDDCDACPSDANKSAPGICGCGVQDTDTDDDGTADCDDNCPDDPDKLDPGICGCGTPDTGACGACLTADDCDDDDRCTVDDCVNGACVHDAVVCPAGEVCDPETGVCGSCMTNGECADDDLCTVDTCVDGGCESATVECPEGQTCDAGTGVCAEQPATECLPALCDDADPCTTEQCVDDDGDGIEECVNTPVECQDGQVCDPDTGVCAATAQAATPFLVKDVNPGSDDSSLEFLTNVNGTLFFQANDGTNGNELWKSDGTEAGTVLVKDIEPGPGWGVPAPHWQLPSIGAPTNVNGTLFFRADDDISGLELWKSDGTEAGTVLVKDIDPGSSTSFLESLTNVNGTLFFTAANDGTSGYALWKSDGTEAGTMLVKVIYPGSMYAYPTSLTNVNGTLFFTSDDGTNGRELWKSDGTEAGTVPLKDFNPGSDYVPSEYLTNVNGTLFFRTDDGTNGDELWKSDGTETGTVLVKDIYPGSGKSDPEWLANVNGTLFFGADDGTNGRELWKSDGTEAGTVLVKDIHPGSDGSSVAYLINVNGTLFFQATDGPNGHALWKSDGTEAGTVLVKDIHPGRYVQDIGPPTNVNGTLFFPGYDTNGRELWKSDGTEAGTVLVMDINPGGDGSAFDEENPANLTNVNGTLFFTADDGTNGRELWALNVSGNGGDGNGGDGGGDDDDDGGGLDPDGDDLCIVETCTNGECVTAPVECPAGQTCDPDTGDCVTSGVTGGGGGGHASGGGCGAGTCGAMGTVMALAFASLFIWRFTRLGLRGR